MAGQCILELFERSGDEHVGQTLLRLARLAAAVHRGAEAESARDGSVVHPPGTDAPATAVRTEANG